MPTEPISQDEYLKEFSGEKRTRALKQALDIRKFEIELYWKRATYFWTFIAAALAGFGAIQVSTAASKTDLSVVLSCLGIVFSVGWLCVNRGSKHWQENWENHVDMLEDDEVGPLYKVVLTRAKPANKREWLEHIVTGPSQLSVSKVNQIISIYVSVLWLCLLFYSLPPFDLSAPINWLYLILIIFTLVTCLAFFGIGVTWKGGYKHFATKRTAHIDNES
ncbi:MAG: hypothetical protein AB2725_06420 [Candidatus Thiodiazotropha endolucinida]